MFNTANSGYSLADIAAATGGNRCNDDGFGGGNGWWVILLFLFLMNGWGWGENGYGRSVAPMGGTTTREEIAYGFDMNGLENSVRAIQNGLCDGFYALNNSLLTGFGNQALNTQQGFAGVDNAICTLGYQTAQLANGITSDMNQNTNAITLGMNNGFNGITAGLTALGTQLQSCCCDTGRAIERGFSDLNYNLATQSCDTRRAVQDSTREILDFLTQDKIASLQSENQTLKFAASQQAQNAYLVSELSQKAPIPAYVVANPYCNCGSANSCNSCCSSIY